MLLIKRLLQPKIMLSAVLGLVLSMILFIQNHASAESNNIPVKVETSSIHVNATLPTPVVPKKMNDPIGRLGSCKPALLRRTASEMAVIASS